MVTEAITEMDVVFSGKKGNIFQINKTFDLKNIHTVVITKVIKTAVKMNRKYAGWWMWITQRSFLYLPLQK